MATPVETAVIKTSDLAEASVLSMHGFTPSIEHGSDRRKAVFVFSTDDPEFVEDLLEDIRCGRCSVEPKRFIRELSHVRKAMYDFLSRPKPSSPPG